MIKLRNVKKSFNSNPVLRDVSLDVNDGESVVLLGRSGCGKSVTLRHILGLIEPDDGEVFVDEHDVNELNNRELYKLRSRMGMLFQNAALWDSLNIFDNVALAIRHHKLRPENEIKDWVNFCLEQVGLNDIGDKFPNELSGGMRKRAGLARAIATKPQYMLYDEPTTGLDPIMTAIIDKLIIKLHDELKVTSLTITHDLTSARRIADRILMLHRGEIRFNGSVEELDCCEDEVVAQFVQGLADGPIVPKHCNHYETNFIHQ